jgi:uncharacterized membrane protein YbhN (UPF0104 family)
LPATSDPERVPDAAPARGLVRHARAIATVLVLLALGAYAVRHAGELDRLLVADPWWLAAMAVLGVGVRWVAAEIMRDTLAEVGHPVRIGDVFGLAAISAVPGLFLPRAGFGALGLSLRTRHGVPFSASSALVLPLSVLDLIVVGVAGLVLQGWLALSRQPHELALTALFAATLGAAVVALFLNPRLPYAPERLARFLANLSDAWQRLRGNRAYVLRALALLVVVTALRTLRLAAAYRAIGFAPDLDGLLLASLLGDLMFMLALTPGALGLREAAIVYGARMAGVTPDASLAAAVLDRLVLTLVLLVLAQGAAWRLFDRRAKAP